MLRSTLNHLTLVSDDAAGLRPPHSGAEREALAASASGGRGSPSSQEPMLAGCSSIRSSTSRPSRRRSSIASRARLAERRRAACVLIADTFRRADAADPEIGEALRADIAAVVERDPACERFIEPFLYFKGFHAIQTHRLAHWLWDNDRRDFALYLQSRSSDVFQTDIHPGRPFRQGDLPRPRDRAGGRRNGRHRGRRLASCRTSPWAAPARRAGDRHPKIRRGAMIGAGAKVLGNIEVGAAPASPPARWCLRPVPAHATVAGVPARQWAR